LRRPWLLGRDSSSLPPPVFYHFLSFFFCPRLAARNRNETTSTQRSQQRFCPAEMEQRRFVQENLSVHLLCSICHEGCLYLCLYFVSLSLTPSSLICIVFPVMTEAVQWSRTPLHASAHPLFPLILFSFSVAEMDIASAILASGTGWAGTKAVPSIASRSQERKYSRTGSPGIWSVAMVSSLLTCLPVCLPLCL
jgi:hypothetical protein